MYAESEISLSAVPFITNHPGWNVPSPVCSGELALHDVKVNVQNSAAIAVAESALPMRPSVPAVDFFISMNLWRINEWLKPLTTGVVSFITISNKVV